MLRLRALLLLAVLATGCNRVTVIHTEADPPVAEATDEEVAEHDACDAQRAVGAAEVAAGLLLAIGGLASHGHHAARAVGNAAMLAGDGAARAAACGE